MYHQDQAKSLLKLLEYVMVDHGARGDSKISVQKDRMR